MSVPAQVRAGAVGVSQPRRHSADQQRCRTRPAWRGDHAQDLLRDQQRQGRQVPLTPVVVGGNVQEAREVALQGAHRDHDRCPATTPLSGRLWPELATVNVGLVNGYLDACQIELILDQKRCI